MSKRILVVEDQPDNRQITRHMLAPTDYEITEAEKGEEALAAIAKQRPDLILTDIQLPIMDGYTATSRIKSDPKLRSIPIIAVPMRLAAKKRRRGQRAAMTACRNLSARANCCRKFGSTCNNSRECDLGSVNLSTWWRTVTDGTDRCSGSRLSYIAWFCSPIARLVWL